MWKAVWVESDGRSFSKVLKIRKEVQTKSVTYGVLIRYFNKIGLYFSHHPILLPDKILTF